MRKKSWVFLIGVLSMLLIGNIATGYAAVSGQCNNCHTMHNSEDGEPMRLDDESEPLSALLVADCLGCHTTDGSDPLVDGYPFVRLASGASDDNCLAGGFFQVTPDTGDNHKNQNHDIGATALPAGYDSNEATDWYAGDTDGLGCAGTNGCHGNEEIDLVDDMAAVRGGHHAPDTYRMLYVGGNPVVGSGAEDYEKAIIANPETTVVTVEDGQNVNIYSAGVSDPSISELCAKCHGDFHNEVNTTDDVGSGSPWLRHPTDEAIPAAWAIGNAGYTPTRDDYKHNPVGYDNATYDITAKRVTCLSCHRAHGTANNDLLRWPYSTQIAGLGPDDQDVKYGCLGCHDKQR